MDETIKAAIKSTCDEVLRLSEYGLTFEPVDDDFDFPWVTYFDMEGNTLRLNYVSQEIIYSSADSMVEEIPVRKVPLQDIRDLLYALEGASLSIYTQCWEDGDTLTTGAKVEGDNLLELFTNLMGYHQDTATQEFFRAELKRLNGDIK